MTLDGLRPSLRTMVEISEPFGRYHDLHLDPATGLGCPRLPYMPTLLDYPVGLRSNSLLDEKVKVA